MHQDHAPSQPPAPAPEGTLAALRRAAATVAPLWPLESYVAVNPYVGMADRRFEDVAHRLAAAGGIRSTLPASWYLDQLDEGRISRTDLEAALARRSSPPAADVDELLALVHADDSAAAFRASIATVADVAGTTTATDWAHLATDRVSAWAAARWDRGQAMWRSASEDDGLYASWRFEAEIDRTPEIHGLRGFRASVRDLPADPVEAAHVALQRLAVPDRALDAYLHRLLLRLGGWSAFVARLGFEAGLRGEEDDSLVQLLAVQLSWEVALLDGLADRGVDGAWAEARRDDLGVRPTPPAALDRLLVFQDALDLAEERRLAQQLSLSPAVLGDGARPAAQAVFCIDVRSEVFRRHLEAVAPSVETLGFAGFFGFPIEYVPLGHEHGGAQCPVLLTPSHVIHESVEGGRGVEAAAHRRDGHHAQRAWKSFKMGAVSCFSFVGPVGLAYLPKLVSDGWGRTRPVRSADDECLPAWASAHRGPDLAPDAGGAGLALDERVRLAEGALRGMSLTSGFAPLVLVTGHGSTTVNNPYATGLDCGACGGRTGEANARVAAAVLNDAAVRAELADRGIAIPDDTWFVACLHDTTTDQVSIFDRSGIPATHLGALAALEAQLAEAGRRARAERAPRLGVGDADDVDAAVLARSRDWAQVRPEWGLAGCRAFVVAPRHRTAGTDLGGRAFLHSYDWRQDEGFSTLELVMTAPMVVASWISLQYYASTVDNERLGSGNKVLHNVVGRIGVLEGNGGDLRVGLPWQSVHDGERYQHEPIRLKVVIEAPIEAMTEVLDRHPDVRALCDNGWLQLLAMDDAGRVSHRYAGDLRWTPLDLDLSDDAGDDLDDDAGELVGAGRG